MRLGLGVSSKIVQFSLRWLVGGFFLGLADQVF
jgi:hypothetical protein